MGTMKTLHVVGFKNSGKTRLITRWVRLVKEQGLTVAVLKHHGHHSPLEMPHADTDTMQFFNHHADVSVVAGAGAVQLLMNHQPDFNRMKDIATLDHPDVLLIEGYKEECGDKVVLLRNEEDWFALQSILDVKLTVGYVTLETGIQHIQSRTAKELDDWLIDWMKENDDETI